MAQEYPEIKSFRGRGAVVVILNIKVAILSPWKGFSPVKSS